MSDATYIELPPEQKKRPFFRTFRGWAICLFILAVIVGAALSWWLSEGRIASAYARVDTNVYTVDAAYATTVEGILTRVGDNVAAGQALARIDPTTFEHPDGRGEQPEAAEEEPARPEATEAAVQEMVGRVNQARVQEERFQKIQQNTVTDHVRSQLILRAMDRNNPNWAQASQIEAAARGRAERAKENFEHVSKLRAGLDSELARMRLEIWRKKQAGIQDAPPAQPKPQPEPEAPAMLYAPVAGEIVSISAQPGASIQPGQTVFTILPSGSGTPRWIQAFFAADAQERLKVGQNVQIHAQNAHYMGKIAEIMPQMHTLPQTGDTPYIVVRITPEDSGSLDNLTPGTGVECQVQTRYLFGEQMAFNFF